MKLVYCEKKDFDYLKGFLKESDKIAKNHGYAYALGALQACVSTVLDRIEILTNLNQEGT